MKYRTKLLMLIQDNIKFPDIVYLNYLNNTIIVDFKDNNKILVASFQIDVDDNKALINFNLAKKIESIYNDLPVLARANDLVKLIQNFK